MEKDKLIETLKNAWKEELTDSLKYFELMKDQSIPEEMRESFKCMAKDEIMHKAKIESMLIDLGVKVN